MLLALDLGGTKLAWAIMDEYGQVAHSGTIPTELINPSSLANILQSRLPDASIDAIGMAVAGACQETRITYCPHLPGWENRDMASVLSSWSVPIRVINDGHAALRGQRWHDRVAWHHALLLTIGTGIGGALCIDGHILSGRHGITGVFGSLRVNRHPLEETASGPAVARLSACQTAEDALTNWHRGDPTARAAFQLASNALYEAVTLLTGLLDVPRVFISGGFGLAAFDALFPHKTLPPSWKIHPIAQQSVQILPVFSSDVTLLGAVDSWLR
ncbi:MAG: ROK family protein [Firmicutes bacterium]|nr:ROK family protein [Bacillota bacterium]